MAGGTRQVRVPLGHEGRHHAAALEEDLGHGLEQGRRVRRRQGLVDAQRRFQHARAGFGVQALDPQVHALAELQKIPVELGVHPAAQHGIAEIAGGDGIQALIVLRPHTVRGLVEDEELELGGGLDRVAQAVGPLQHAAQHAARAYGLGRAGEFAEHQGDVALMRQVAHSVGQEPDRRVRIGGVPAGEAGVVIELVVAVPAQHHVAEAVALMQRR